MKKHFLALAITSVVSQAYAAGPLLPELGSLNVSTAGAGSAALAESALTAWTNPAGMSQLEEMNVTMNAALLDTTFDYTDAGSTGAFANGQNADGGTLTPAASFYFATPINDKFHGGIALASQGGSGVDYGKNFHGQSLLENAEFVTVQIAPAISYKVNEELAVGMSANFEYFTANGELDVLPGSLPTIGTGVLEAEANDFNVGYSLSAFYKPNNNHRFGLIYRSEIAHYGEGDVKASHTGFLDTAPSADVGLDFIMPAHLQASGVHTVIPKWDLLWSVTWYDLSTWTDLTLDINDSPIPVVTRNFDDVWNFAIGTHYQLSRKVRLETGISYETSPQDNPNNIYMDVPLGEIWRFGLGATYKINRNWEMRGYYDYIDLSEPEIDYTLDVLPNLGNMKGSYESHAHYVGLQVNYRFK
ncbi:MAG: OmpP1/FadL family transporter [Vibrio gallaecicus]|uniref:OmpP1/FadL family transporter n=1 Tax=Vibrio gallaecicus TaxID=552386 RepID=A0ABV4NEC1_9VIBR